MTKYSNSSRFVSHPSEPENRCRNCRNDFHDHYNGACPIDENEEEPMVDDKAGSRRASA